ncbi:L-tyrosine decarboxylase [Methanococcoides methylutens]|uniref:Probable L-tyrosine/L-aspartate decarboxylase n=1 Tax=Methanococcoides methylutens TaxID=2226 RepID=A0A099T2P7_METMT|nr:tyrosine decarboxylase MfnA [Methanococcoides methylutens]KGK98496.1 L-tyrosine decarboxylase [Methanococcoides methylutens]
MEESGIPRDEILSILKNAKSADTSYDRVLSSMCTYPHEIAVLAHTQFIEANMGDPGLFPGTYDLEKKVLKMFGSLLHHNNDPEECGYLTTGGTESNIQAIRSMVNYRRDIKKPNVVMPESAHFSFDKVADLSGIEIRKASLDHFLKVDLGLVRSLIDENTIGLVGIAGTTEFGQIDPIEQLSEIALEKNLFLHVDAAFGGFVLPFMDLDYHYDFEVEGVTSMTIDPHKMGLSTIPSGGLLFRETEYLNDLEIHTPYLSINKQYSLTGTRSGAAVASTYAVMKHLGREGYRQVIDQCMEQTEKIVEGAKALGIEPVIDPVMNVVALQVPDADNIRKRLLDEFGWHVSITRKPRALRLVIMPHINNSTIELFLNDLEKLI